MTPLHRYSACILLAATLPAAAQAPAQTSFDCRKAAPGTVAETVCRDPALAELGIATRF